MHFFIASVVCVPTDNLIIIVLDVCEDTNIGANIGIKMINVLTQIIEITINLAHDR